MVPSCSFLQARAISFSYASRLSGTLDHVVAGAIGVDFVNLVAVGW